MKKIALLAFAFALLSPAVIAAVLTNADVVKMAQAKLDDAIILSSIQNTEANFDTSAQGLIDLSAAKVPAGIIDAMIKKNKAPAKAAEPTPAPKSVPTPAPASPASASPAADSTEAYSPSEIFLIDGSETKAMRYINPQMRSSARGLGFGGFATYAVLRGPQASERTKNTQPTFLVSVPTQAQPESYVTIASFAVRQNNSREVLIGGGYMSYSSGIHPDRVVAITSEKAADQSRAQKGFIIYQLTPKRPLASGEYAVILYTGEMQGLVGAWFVGGANSYFDFGIDR